MTFLKSFLMLSLLTAPTSTVMAQGTLDLSATTLPRSGRLVILGGGFGEAGSGRVLVDGHQAIVTSWSDSRIHAYVPEGAGPGPVPVQVDSGAGLSEVAYLDVTLRAPQGRTKWRFQLESAYAGPWSVIGPDDTVYTSDVKQLYALTPDGGLEWVLPGVGDGKPISFASDGTLYAATSYVAGEPQGVVAVNPDGTVKWTFTFPDGHDLLVGPNVGPDGHIYGVQDTSFGGAGAFALDEDGNLLWTTPGPFSTVGSDYNVLFVEDRLFAAYQSDASAPPTIRAYDYDGNQLWNSSQLGLRMGSYPELDPSGRLILAWGLIGEQAWDQDANVEWVYDPPGALGNVVAPTVGPDGVVYNGTWIGGDLFAVNPDGTTRWLIENGVSGSLGVLAVTPDNAVLLDGGSPGFGSPSFLRGFDPATGKELFRESFVVENGLNEFAFWIEPAITADSRTAYVTTRFSSGTQGGYLVAVDIDPASSGAIALQVSGSCPGSVTVDVSNAPPRSEVGIVAAANANGFVKGGATCAGLTLDIGEPFQLPPTWIVTDGSGAGSAAMTLEADRCWIEAIAVANCSTSAASQIP